MIPESPREAARVYAHSLGWSVLAIWPPKDGHCTCPIPNCPSPGKHPHEFSKSVHGSTTDLSEIESWPADVNVGIHLGVASGGMMVLDIDQPEVADMLLSDADIAAQTAVSTTGRGTHIYFHCTGSTKGFNLKDANDVHLGEVRGDSQFVVLPPSQHVMGVRYAWRSLDQVEDTDDAQTWVLKLLKSVGVEAKIAAEHVGVDVPDLSIEPEPLPRVLNNGYTHHQLKALAFGNVSYRPEHRFAFLYESAMQIVEAYEAVDIPVDAETIAAHVRWLHDKLNLRKHSGSREFLRLGLKALERHPQPAVAHDVTVDGEVLEHQPSEIAVIDPDSFVVEGDDVPPVWTAPLEGEYRWDKHDEVLYVYRKFGNAKDAKPSEVCNFEPVLMTEYEVDDAETIIRSWRIHLLQSGHEPFEVVWHEADRAPNKIGTTLAKLPARFIIRPRMHEHLIAATSLLSKGDFEIAHEYATTGWVEHNGQPHYLLPSMEGAIGPDGMDPLLRLHPEHLPETAAAIASPELAPYGRGVRPPATREEMDKAFQAFMALVNSSKSRGKTMAVVLQVLAGPLIPAGAGETPPLLHVRGGTGTLKTSFSTTAMSLFGTWIRDLTPPPTTWGSTAAFLQAMVHGTKDLTLLIDDYKSGVVDKGSSIGRLIQQYADRTSRGRANTRGGITMSQLPRGLILSNGEDVWEHVASGEARTIEFIFGKGEIDRNALTLAQDHVRRGHLQLFGGAWIQWIAQNWDDLVGQTRVRERRDIWRMKLAEEHPEAHMRVVTQVAVLGAVGSVLLDFIRSTWPKYAIDVERALNESIALLVGGVGERAQLVKEAAPFRQLAIALNEAVVSGNAAFRNRGHSSESLNELPIPSQVFHTVPVVGYHWRYDGRTAPNGPWVEGERLVLLTDSTAMDFFRKLSRSTGLPPNFTWKSVLWDAIEGHRGVAVERIRVSIDRAGKPSQLSGVVVPLDEIQNAERQEQSNALLLQ